MLPKPYLIGAVQAHSNSLQHAHCAPKVLFTVGSNHVANNTSRGLLLCKNEHEQNLWRGLVFMYYLWRPMHFTPCLKKLCKLIFCQNFVKFRPIVTVFGIQMAKRTGFSAMYSISTSPNLCERTTVLKAYIPNCYIML